MEMFHGFMEHFAYDVWTKYKTIPQTRDSWIPVNSQHFCSLLKVKDLLVKGIDQKVCDSCALCDHSCFAVSKITTAWGVDFTINKPTDQPWIPMTSLMTPPSYTPYKNLDCNHSSPMWPYQWEMLEGAGQAGEKSIIEIMVTEKHLLHKK